MLLATFHKLMNLTFHLGDNLLKSLTPFYIDIYICSIFSQNVPPDLSQCVFVIEQALSVRALQELVTAASSETVSPP